MRVLRCSPGPTGYPGVAGAPPGQQGSTLGGMRSSSDPADDDARQRVAAMRLRQRPDNEVPVSIAFDAVVGEAADLVVYISGVHVFRAVLGFQLTVLARHHSPAPGLTGALFGHGEQPDRLLLGVEYADGRTGSNLSGMRALHDLEFDPLTPVLMQGGGGGGDLSADVTYYLSPLPPPGLLRIITAWPGHGIAETVTEVAAAPFIEAATRVRLLWDLDPDEAPSEQPQPPDMPSGGWFDRSR